MKIKNLKIIAPILVFIIAAIFFSVDLDHIQGRLDADISVTTPLEMTTPQEMLISSQEVNPNDIVTIKIVDDKDKETDLPKNWKIEVTNFITPGIETVIASTEQEDAKIIISREELGKYSFSAPSEAALYGIFLVDGEDQLQANMVKIKVNSL